MARTVIRFPIPEATDYVSGDLRVPLHASMWLPAADGADCFDELVNEPPAGYPLIVVAPQGRPLPVPLVGLFVVLAVVFWVCLAAALTVLFGPEAAGLAIGCVVAWGILSRD